MKYEAQKGNRIKHNFIGFLTFDRAKNGINWMYNETLKQWEHGEFKPDCEYSNMQNCKSLRAFRRKLKRAPTGVFFTLVSRYNKHDISTVSK